MIHARDDYNHIQDPANKIPADEPVFLLRAQDELACKAVAYYASLCEAAQAPGIAAKARAHFDAMAAWPVKKIPDLPSGSVATQPTASNAGERETFEAYIAKDCGDLSTFGVPPNRHYKNSGVNHEWLGWQARAALATKPPAGEQKPDGRLHADGYFTWSEGKRPAYIADRGLPCDFYLAPALPEQVAQDKKGGA